jgi:hypothetical protein
MSRALFQLAVIMAIAWGWAWHAQAQSVTTGPQDRRNSMYVLVLNNSAGEQGVQATERSARATVVEKGSDLAQAQADTAKVKTKAHRKARPKAPTETEIGAETRQRLYELQLLDVLRSAGQR